MSERTFKIVCICQVYNELRKGNLERFIKYTAPLVDEIVFYDDASTDGSYELMLDHTPNVIRGLRNDFPGEIDHKSTLLKRALHFEPDFILSLDADEVLTANASTRLQELCDYCVRNNLDGLSLHELNLWRSSSWKRLDSQYDEGWFVRLWRVTPDMSFGVPARGLHQRAVPPCVEKVEKVNDVALLHYGFASERSLAHKYLVYREHGQQGWLLTRLIDEKTLCVEKVPKEVFPAELYFDDVPPQPLSFEAALTYVEHYREEVSIPAVSIICLIYKSVAWLRFIREQVLRYTHLCNRELIFVANDAEPIVLQYLQDNYIRHVVWNNNDLQKNEWYINNVYRAWNYGANKARGDYLVFINSDMAFTPNWLENLFEKLDGHNVVASRLIESGKLPSGRHGISHDHGRTIDTYDEPGFLEHASSIQERAIGDGGLFMPLLMRRDDFRRVKGYPEGNIVPGSPIFEPKIARKGEPCISGDVVLMDRLTHFGIKHQTSFDSVVYHFQCGEMDDAPTTVESSSSTDPVVICNDYLTGRMGEKTMWDFLLDALPGVVGVDIRVVGADDKYEKLAHRHINELYPTAKIVVQNASFIDLISPERFTILYLQDNLRRMGRTSRQQEENLRRAQVIVTNSLTTAASYPEYDIRTIPIGVDANLFHPMDKSAMRLKHGLSEYGKIAIFVGAFTDVKGWPDVQRVVDKRKDIFWLLISKDDETYAAPHVRTHNRIGQTLLAELLNCADFFIVGSPVETQCLAAIEACLCDVPVVMRLTGIFVEFSDDERARVGVFGTNFESAVELVYSTSFTPRAVMFERRLLVDDMVRAWHVLLEDAHLRVDSDATFLGHKGNGPNVVGPRLRYYREPWWSQERLKREVKYHPRAYAVLSVVYRPLQRVKSNSIRICESTLRSVLPEPAFRTVRNVWRRIRS